MTKKTEKEVLKIYDTWLNSYLNGDVKTYDKYLDDDYHFIGSTNNEEFLNRRDTTNFFKDTAEQFTGKTQLRNETKTLEQFGELIFVTHVFDAWFLNENEWTYYSRFRFSSILQEKKEGWKFIYQHFSIADSKADEGETIGFDKVNAENLELREAIKRRTIELEQKNRELEVEGALERIRAQAVAMQQSSDLLDIVVTMRNEFTKLGHEAHYFWHMMWLPETYEKAMTSGDGSRIGFVMELPRHIHGDIPLLAKWEKSKKATVVYAMDADEAIDYVDKMVALGDFQNIDPQAPSHDDIRLIGGLTFIMARTSHGEIGYSLPGVVENPQKEDLEILERFAGAFDLAHRRFLDLQKAEKQRREVEIELALEKVRSRSMAMHTTSELQEVIETIHKEFNTLNIAITGGVFIAINEDLKKEINCWGAGGTTNYIERVHIPFLNSPIYTGMIKKIQKGSGFFIEEFSNDQKKKFFEHLFKHPPYSNTSKKHKDEVINREGGYTRSCAVSENTSIFMINHHGEKFSEIDNEILKRFAKVFEQTYTRFLDLQKAEAQARESEIELALERVRARTMAMQHSDELQEASFLLDEQVRALGIKTWGCAFNIYGKTESKEWFGNEAGILPTYTVPRKGIFKKYYEYGQKGEEFIVEEFKGKACIDHYEYMSSLPVIGDVLKNLKKTNNGFPTYQLDHVVYFKYGYLLFITKEHAPEAYDVFKRFAKVFEQTYTRFLDLQKAEAQAREAQIEVALEKVRSRTMAMQKGEELQDVVVLLYKELIALGVTNFATCGYVEINEKTNRQLTWVTSPGGDSLGLFHLPLTGDSVFDERYEAWKRQQIVFHQTVAGEKRLKHLEYAITTFNSKEAEEMVLNQFPDPTVFYCFNFSHGYLHLVAGSELNEEEESLLARFTKIFEQTYARFLDLQKAEAQARESEIELALERVRAKSMAMQKSDELKEVIKIVYQQLTHLKINLKHSGFVVDYTPKGDWHFWIADEQDIPSQISHPYFESVWGNQFNDAKEKDEDFFATNLNFEEKNKFYNELLTFIPELPKVSKDFYLSCPGLAASTVLLDNVGLYIENFEGIPYTDEENSILKRFGKVFQQTYTRFLDLQKAEAQTREAQINLAVERVRAKALAMHQSEEIMEVVAKLKDEVMSLDIPNVVAATIFLNEGDDKVRMWDLSTLEKDDNGYDIPFDITFKLKKTDPHLYVKRVWENPKNYFVEIQEEKDFKRIIAWLRENDKIEIANEVEKFTESTQLKQLFHAVKKLNNGKLVIDLLNPPSAEMETILTKMGAAFDLAYKRFEDLQKAEAQAREAQIEASLERVRSRSMAMHTSEELLDVISVVSEQLQHLEFKFVHVSFANNDIDGNYKFWTSAKAQSKPMRFNVPNLNLAVFNNLREAQKKSLPFFTDIITKDEHSKWHKHLLNNRGSNVFSKKDNEFIMSRGMARSIAINPNIILILANYASIPYSEADNKIIERFGQVFEQSYTRFLDLQKAEEQAKVAKIEVALEKVRSRTMAMQKSEELPEAANNLFLQVQKLGIPAWSAGYCIWQNDKKDANCNMSSEGEIQKNFLLPTIGEGYNFSDPLKNGKTFHVSELGGKKLVKHYDFMKTLPIIGEVLEGFDKKGISLPTFQIFHIVYFKFGYVMFITYESVPDAHDIFKRFGQVFEQTYTRFLDLKLKEDQATKLAKEKRRLEKTLSDLQATQEQLIQSEKMASLGELTAGIAHEIQNPLNFVNNFSEVSKELLEEMLEEIENGDMEEVKAIMSDVVLNLEKINHHGNRADGIVKGMLQHSRAGGDKKEPTDINALADEYLRLAYHGLRAKDKSFNSELVTDFDDTIKTIEAIPQDIGRVILNLLTNAFYACTERSRSMVNEKKKLGIKDYDPTVAISTKKKKNSIIITVKDNGNGMPESVKEKIFQPFFTTKPTGQGTGLGLSMSYDIVTKGHGGELKVETNEGVGTTFIIKLPINQPTTK